MLSTSTSCGGADRIYRRHSTYQLAQLGRFGPTRSMYRICQERCVRWQAGIEVLSPEESRVDSSVAYISFCNAVSRVPFLNVGRLDQKKSKSTFSLSPGSSFNDDNELKYEVSVTFALTPIVICVFRCYALY